MNNTKVDSRFTVLMPILDRPDIAKILAQAVASVFDNTIRPKTLLLVVDGPVSESFKQKILTLRDIDSIEIVWTVKRVGLTQALNIGLSRIDTLWTFRADGDDINQKTRFESQLKYLEMGYQLVGGDIREFSENGVELHYKKSPQSQLEITKASKFRNPFNHMTVAFVTELAVKMGSYPDIYLREDYGLWALFLKNKYKVINLNMVLVNASAGENMYKRRGGTKYIFNEFKLQKHLIACGLTKPLYAYPIGLLRVSCFLMPTLVKGLMYKYFLRSTA
jgi:glycosyltransferase involved in cell wall biosynthesis